MAPCPSRHRRSSLARPPATSRLTAESNRRGEGQPLPRPARPVPHRPRSLQEESTQMLKVEAIVRQEKLPFVRGALEELGLTGLTITQVLGHGAQKGITHQWKGNTYRVDLVPKVKVEMVIQDSLMEAVLTAIQDSARTGEVGDGKVFV